jgi:hypothetical protein
METSVLYREVHRPSIFLLWPLIVLCVGVVIIALGQELHLDQVQQPLFVFLIMVAVIGAALAVDLFAVVVEVTRTEIRFSIAPFYHQRIIIAHVAHCKTRTGLRRVQFRMIAGYTWRQHYVDLAMQNGSIFSVLTQHPERLVKAIHQAQAAQSQAAQ